MTEIEGLARLVADLGDAGERIVERASQVVRKTGLDVVADGMIDAPVDTGATRSSIHMSMLGPLEAEMGPTTSYAHFVHDGTSRIAPNPYMDRALDRHAEPFAEALAQIGDLP